MRTITLSLALLASAAPALASGGGGEGSPSLFAGDVGNLIWTLVIFLVVLWVLGKFAWGPILEGLQGREKFISDSLEQAKQQRDEAAALLEQYEEKLAAARSETEAILDEARRDADAVRKREEERAKEEADKLLARARREIEIATETAVKELYTRAAKLSTVGASRILEREISAADHERLIEESIAAIEQMEN
ncbi:MAG: F0F1 ATP synthase subunit B [Acidobacteria bacterium]|nr:F0F1 ATP synthase subunit B [Acidobacteriota bacterium]